jgi:polyhydroxyalkanoate synthesis regulator phasin
MKKYLLLILVFGMAFSLSPGNSPSWAGESDVIVNFLVKKGILTPEEAKELISELQKEGTREKEEVKKTAKKAAEETAEEKVKSASFKLPDWVKKTKIKGDVRIRYQKEDQDNNPGTENRDRVRVRGRVGIIGKVNEHWEGGIGLATGANDPRSTNQTLQNTFDTPDIRLDYAYAKYAPFSWGSVIAGKFKNPFWGTKDLLWDGDIRPEGVAATLKYKPIKEIELWATPAYFILENIAGTADPNMFAVQAGIKATFAERLWIKVAPTLYRFNQVEGYSFTAASGGWSRGTNSVDLAGNWLFDHDAVAVDAEIGVKIHPYVPMFAVFGQYVKSDADDSSQGIPSRYGEDDDTGYLFGAKLGHSKIKKFGQWQLKYNYRRLENDAWPDWLPDSDAYGGRTNIKGHEYEFKFGLHKNVELAVDYYDTKPIRTDPVAPFGGLVDGRVEKVFQGDIVLKW